MPASVEYDGRASLIAVGFGKVATAVNTRQSTSTRPRNSSPDTQPTNSQRRRSLRREREATVVIPAEDGSVVAAEPSLTGSGVIGPLSRAFMRMTKPPLQGPETPRRLAWYPPVL
jgi:hypothetical protein